MTLTIEFLTLKWCSKLSRTPWRTCVQDMNSLNYVILTSKAVHNSTRRRRPIVWPCDLQLWPSAFEHLSLTALSMLHISTIRLKFVLPSYRMLRCISCPSMATTTCDLDLWPFDLKTGPWVTRDMGFRSIVGYRSLFFTHESEAVTWRTDRQTDTNVSAEWVGSAAGGGHLSLRLHCSVLFSSRNAQDTLNWMCCVCSSPVKRKTSQLVQ